MVAVRVGVAGTNTSGRACEDDAFPGVGEGEQVAIYDAQGAIVGMGELSTSKFGREGEDLLCGWETRLNVPAGGKYYRAAIREWQSEPKAESDVDKLVITLSR